MITLSRMRPLLGTFVEITATGIDPQGAIEAAFETIAVIEAKMSYYDPASDISRINALIPNTPLKIDPKTWHLLHECETFSRLSEGLFDITVASKLVELEYLPPLYHQKATGDWKDILLMKGGYVQVSRPVCIDLGGIAKGYGVDCAIETLQTHHIVSATVNAGGDLRHFGPKAEPLYVRHPSYPSQTLPITQLDNAAAATSAGYYSRTILNNISLTPLIHPKTGLSLTCDYSVTVLSPSCMVSDALTKIVHADPADAKEILDHYRARALLLKHDRQSDTIQVFDSHSA